MRTAGVVIARNPVLVWILIADDVDRTIPGNAIRGAANCNLVIRAADRQRADNPLAEFAVIGHRGIAGSAVGTAARTPLSQAREISIRPRDATVQRRCKPNVGTPATVDTGHLERRNNHGAIGQSVRFNFCHVLASAVGKAVLADLAE